MKMEAEYSLFFAGLLFFPFCFSLLNFVQRFFFSHYFAEEDVNVISMRSVSALQALFASISGAIIIYHCSDDIMHDTHWLTNAYACFGMPYFYYDIFAMYRADKHLYCRDSEKKRENNTTIFSKFIRDNKMMMLHHSIMPLIIFPVIVTIRKDLGDFFVGCFYMFELAVPWISLRAILKQLKRTDTVFYLMTGVANIITYAICRVLIFPYLYYAYSRYAGVSFFSVPFLIPKKCTIGCAAMLVFQLYWMWYMIRIAIKTVKKIKRKRDSICKKLKS